MLLNIRVICIKKGANLNMEKVKWKYNFFGGADAQKVYEEIGSDASISAEEVLKKAQADEHSELHKCFEWDDAKAGHLYRLEQARHVIANLVFVTDTEDEAPVRVFHISTEKSTYKPTKLILQQPNEYQALLERAKQELYAFQRKYKSLQELDEVFTAIDAL